MGMLRKEREARLATANEMLTAIASCGRKFFRYGETISRFELDDRERVWFVDKYTGKRIYTHYKYEWRGFSDGGTLRRLIDCLQEFILEGKPLRAHIFGPWTGGIIANDLWGYGEDMQKVRDAAAKLGITAAPALDVAA